jgi:hypothetical protein
MKLTSCLLDSAISDIELVIDLRVARAMGMRISQDLLLRANDVIL